MRLLSATLAFAIVYLPSVNSIFADEAYQIDYHYALLGVPQSHATFFHRPQIASPAALLYTVSEKGVVGAVNPKDGSAVWRQPLHTDLKEKSKSFIVPGDGVVVTALISGVTAWDALDGRLAWNASERVEGEPKDLIRIPASDTSNSYDFVILYGDSNGVVQKLDGATGKLLWKHSDTSDYNAFALAPADTTIYYIATTPAVLKGSKIKVISIDPKSGQETKQYTLSVDSNFLDAVVKGIGGDVDRPFLFWADSSMKTIKTNLLGSNKIQTHTFDNDSGEEIAGLNVHVTNSPQFLVHLNTLSKSWAEVYNVDAKSSAISKTYSLPVESSGITFTATKKPSQTQSYFVKISSSDVTLFSSDSDKVLAQWSRKSEEASVLHAAAEVVRGPNSFAVRVALTSNSGEWTLIRNGDRVWYRPEMLTNVKAAVWVAVESAGALAEELEIERHKSFITAYVHRVSRHVRDLPKLGRWLQSLPQAVLDSLVSGTGPDKTSLAARKILLLASDTRLYALDSSKGGLLWRTSLPPYDRKRQRRMWLTVEGQEATLLIDGAATFVFDIIDGQRIAARGCPDFSSITQVPGIAGPSSVFVSQQGQPIRIPRFSTDGEFLVTKDGDRKVLGWSLAEESKLLWSFTPSPGSKIVNAVSRPSHDPVASIGKVLGNRSVLYKYLSPNIALITSTSEDSLTVTLLDSITGTVLYTTTHTYVDTSFPIPSVISENWFAYSFFGNPDPSSSPFASSAKGHHLIITELYESPFPNDRGPLGPATNYSAFSLPSPLYPPHPISQAFIIPQPISHLSVSQTAQGITSRQLLAYLPATQALIGIPRAVLDPRRPVDRDPTSSEAQEEGLFRYAPFLDFDPKWYLSHAREVLGTRRIMAAPTMLESTGLVFAWGHDVFGTRVAPSMAFDVLGKGFNRASLVATVVALAGGVGVLAPMVRRRQVDGRWKML